MWNEAVEREDCVRESLLDNSFEPALSKKSRSTFDFVVERSVVSRMGSLGVDAPLSVLARVESLEEDICVIGRSGVLRSPIARLREAVNNYPRVMSVKKRRGCREKKLVQNFDLLFGSEFRRSENLPRFVIFEQLSERSIAQRAVCVR